MSPQREVMSESQNGSGEREYKLYHKFAWKVLQRFDHHLEATNFKIAAIVPLHIALIALIADSNGFSNYPNDSWLCYVILASIILSILAIMFSFSALSPDTRAPKPDNLIFFNVGRIKETNYVTLLTGSSDLQLVGELGSEIVVIRKILEKKYRRLKLAIFFSVIVLPVDSLMLYVDGDLENFTKLISRWQ